ncbi:MAG: hypothetical protein Tsb0014_06600 [Pleurocapsa sp.]
MKVNTSQRLKTIFSWLGKIYWLVIIILLLSSCGYRTPPKELAPTGEIVKQAIALQLRQTEQTLAQKLNLADPEIKISNIRVKQLQPIFVADLPTYHLQGKYNLQLKLSRRQIEQKNNAFDVYLQRQAEGKTWRLLRKEYNENNERQWSSYLIDS